MSSLQMLLIALMKSVNQRTRDDLMTDFSKKFTDFFFLKNEVLFISYKNLDLIMIQIYKFRQYFKN